MTKILIEIDTDTQRVVPLALLDSFPEINPSNYDHDDACALNAWGVELILAAAPQPEPVDADLRRDAERLNWLLEHPDATVCSDGSYGPVHIWFRYSNKLVGYGSKTAREAIDAAISQGEQK